MVTIKTDNAEWSYTFKDCWGWREEKKSSSPDEEAVCPGSSPGGEISRADEADVSHKGKISEQGGGTKNEFRSSGLK